MQNFISAFLVKSKEHKYILSRTFIIISGSLFANVFAYLFQLITGRYLSVPDYAILVTLFSLSGVFLALLNFITGGTNKLVAEIKDDDYPNRISRLFTSIFKIQFLLSLAITLILFTLTPLLSETLKIPDKTIIYAFIMAIFAGNLIGFMTPFLQGLLRFKAYSFSLFLASFTKLLIGLVVIAFGLGLTEIFWGLFIATLVVGVCQVILLKKNIHLKNTEFAKKDMSELVKYSLYSSFGIVGLSLLQNVDVIMVKSFFDETTAGIYGSITVIGRVIFFLASPIVIIMLPICAQNYKRGENFIKPFFMAVFIAFAISFVGFLCYVLFPEFIVNILFSEKYIAATPYLGMYALYMIFYTLLNVVTVFFISVSKFKYAAIAFFAPLMQFIGITFFHENLSQVIYVNLITCVIFCIAMYGFVIKMFIIKSHGNR